MRRRRDLEKREFFFEKYKSEKMFLYFKFSFCLNRKNNCFSINFVDDKLFFMDQNLKKIFLPEENKNNLIEDVILKKSTSINKNNLHTKKNIITNSKETEILKFDDFINNLFYFDVSNNIDNQIDKKNMTKNVYKNSIREESIKISQNFNRDTLNEKLNIPNVNDQKLTLNDKLKEYFSKNNIDDYCFLKKNNKNTFEDDFKLRRTQTKFLNVSDNINLIDQSSDDINYKCGKNLLNCFNNKTGTPKINLSNRRKIKAKSLEKKNTQNLEEKKINFEFTDLGKFYYLNSQENEDINDFNIINYFNLMNNNQKSEEKLKKKKVYFHVYFRKIKLSEKELDINNKNVIINKSNEENIIEFILYDITKEISYEKKLLKQKLKINNLSNCLFNEIKYPMINIDSLINSFKLNERSDRNLILLDNLKNFNLYISSNLYVSEIALNDNYSYNMNNSKKLNLCKKRLINLLDFIFNFCENFLKSDFFIKRKITFNYDFPKNVNKLVIFCDDNILKQIVIKSIMILLKYIDSGIIHIHCKIIQIKNIDKVDITFYYAKLIYDEDEKIISNDQKEIIKKFNKNIFNEDFYNSNKIISNSLNNNDEESPYLKTNHEKDEDSDQSILNKNIYVNYFTKFYRKTFFKYIYKTENSIFTNFKKICKNMDIEFKFNLEFFSGKEAKIIILMPLKIEDFNFTSNKIDINSIDNLDNFSFHILKNSNIKSMSFYNSIESSEEYSKVFDNQNKDDNNFKHSKTSIFGKKDLSFTVSGIGTMENIINHKSNTIEKSKILNNSSNRITNNKININERSYSLSNRVKLQVAYFFKLYF